MLRGFTPVKISTLPLNATDTYPCPARDVLTYFVESNAYSMNARVTHLLVSFLLGIRAVQVLS